MTTAQMTAKILELGLSGICIVALATVVLFLYKQTEKLHTQLSSILETHKQDMLERSDAYLKQMKETTEKFSELCRACNKNHCDAAESISDKHRAQIKEFYDTARQEHRELSEGLQSAMTSSTKALNDVCLQLKELCVLFRKN